MDFLEKKKKGTLSSDLKNPVVVAPVKDSKGRGGGVRFPPNIFLSKPGLLLLKPE